MKNLLLITCLMLLCASCGNVPLRSASTAAGTAGVVLAGDYDNHEQVWSARASGAAAASAHVVIAVEQPARDWTLWQVRFDAAQPLHAIWALQRTASGGWLPHRALQAQPGTGKSFDPKQWAALDACTLRGTSSRARADVAACAAIVPGLGVQAALLPIAFEADGEWLRVRLYADQARGADAGSDLRRVAWFTGWAAVNGGGPNAAADSTDWHMDRGLRLAAESGRWPLRWRDGKPSGWSLALERLTYRDGNIPVLKLSIVDDASGGTLAYAWANPEANRIGINLGWVQVGLEREGTVPRSEAK